MTRTLSRHDQTRHAVWDARACCQESNAHDDIRDPKCISNNSHLQEKRGNGAYPEWFFSLNVSTAITNYKNLQYDFILKTPFECVFLPNMHLLFQKNVENKVK